jgi:hypothetical protein
MTDDAEQTSEQSKLSSVQWSSDDSKLFVVTLAGTIAANLATVLIVALSIAVARWMLSGSHFNLIDAAMAGFAILVSAFIFYLLIIWNKYMPTTKRFSAKWLSKQYFNVLAIIVSSIGVIFLLALAGVASGIH